MFLVMVSGHDYSAVKPLLEKSLELNALLQG
jgi:hypothetical protein